MASEIKSNKISPATGTAFTLGDSGDTFTIPSGTTLDIASGATIANSGTATGFGSDNTPAFQAYISSNQALGDNVYATVAANTEDFDTDSAYDTSTYTFTVPSGEGGKYFLYFYGDVQSGGGGTHVLNDTVTQIRINSESSSTARFSKYEDDYHSGNTRGVSVSGVVILSAADTVQFWIRQNVASGYASNLLGTSQRATVVGGYKLIGV